MEIDHRETSMIRKCEIALMSNGSSSRSSFFKGMKLPGNEQQKTCMPENAQDF
jgi:hypothetical protein